MNKFQKLSQLNKDIELLENAGKIKAAEVLHKKFIREAQYGMPQYMASMMPQMFMPPIASMMPQMFARPTVAPAAVARPVAPVVQPAPVAAPAPKPAPAPIGETPKPGTTPAPPPPPPPPTGQTTPPGKPTEQGTYLMNPGDDGKTIFTDPGTGKLVDPPNAGAQFDYYYGKIQEAYRLPEPQKSQMLKNLYEQIRQRKDKLGDRLQGSLYNYLNI